MWNPLKRIYLNKILKTKFGDWKINLNVQTLAGRYRIHGGVRFLSHQEAFRVIQRTLVRSGIGLIYSQGYNPHPKLSLPLPKSVGLASEDEVFCAQIAQTGPTEKNFENIAGQLPLGFSLTDIAVHNGKVTYKPVEAEYLIEINERESKEISAAIDMLNGFIEAGEKIMIERILDEEGSVKTIDVSGFLKSFEQVSGGVRVICKITDKGTIRLGEILRLLKMEPNRIGSSVIRKKVNWQIT